MYLKGKLSATMYHHMHAKNGSDTDFKAR